MQKRSPLKRIARIAFFSLVAIGSIWALKNDLAENSGYNSVNTPYRAHIISYETGYRRKSPVVEVRFEDGSTKTFTSKKDGRHEWFAIGAPVSLVHKREKLHPLIPETTTYEIDYLPYRYGWSAIYAGMSLLTGLVLALEVADWRKSKNP